jgi:predicted nucleotidyltransferase
MGQALADTLEYPGTSRHQAMLRAIVAYYAADPRILAVVVFGSLGRGTWDALSDVDLDIVVADGVAIDAVDELGRLCESFAGMGERVALIVPDGDDAGDVVFESLMQLSVRYHPLSTTSPNIVDSMRVLGGAMDHATIAAAGLANQRAPAEPLERLLARCVRYAAVADVMLERGQVWGTVEVLHRMRVILMALFARTHDGTRAYQVFEREADAALQARLGSTLPRYDLDSLRSSLGQCIHILEHDLGRLTDGQVKLADGHRAVLHNVRLCLLND